jgi:hypothetical protein
MTRRLDAVINVGLILMLCSTMVHSVTVKISRRGVLANVLLTPAAALSLDEDPPLNPTTRQPLFLTTAFGRQEYTNSITASRDTNLSPAEAYDIIRQQVPAAVRSSQRALDLGAGAGLSTQVLYQTLGYRNIDAVDWSSTAWLQCVTQQPASVQFHEMSDDDFFATLEPQQHYDVIVYNFAINPSKAVEVAQTWLRPESGILLAPCNDRRDYWYKQSYLVLNSNGSLVWKSGEEVGAWSVQFQPDVTSENCTGIWCGSVNGYLSRRGVSTKQ